MNLGITKSFIFSSEDHILRQATVSKKSKYLKTWRKRRMILYSNKIVFLADDQNKPRNGNIVYLGNVQKVATDEANCQLIKIYTSDGTFQVSFADPREKQSWVQDIREAERTYRINFSEKSQSRKMYKCTKNQLSTDNLVCFGFTYS